MENKNKKMETDGTTSEYFRCVQCGSPIKTLYIQYSPGNIRLMKCGKCKAIADEYIECEIMILVIDLILHKPKAYRHLFYNKFSKETVDSESLLGKSVSAFLILDIYRMWVLTAIGKESNSSVTVGSMLLDFPKMLSSVIFGNLIFLCVMFHGTRKLFSTSAGFYGWKEILLVVLVSSYFKIFLMATMVWEFPSSVIFIIDMFVISSNIVALKVITNSAIMRCLAVGLFAHSLKFIATYGFITYPKLIQLIEVNK